MVRVPIKVRAQQGGGAFVYKTLTSGDRRTAKIEAAHWEAGLRAEWAALTDHDGPAMETIRASNKASLREVYEQVLRETVTAARDSGVLSPDALEGIDAQLTKLAEEAGEHRPGPVTRARVAALNDAAKVLQGRPVEPREELEPPVGELADEFIRWWKAQGGLKGNNNTEQQKRATFTLFAGFWGERPLRSVGRGDAARFLDAVRLLDPAWARSAKSRALPWAELQRRFGGQGAGLSDATMNRHAATLAQLWDYAEDRYGYTGANPFKGFRRRLRQGVNVKGYVPWNPDELKHLLDPPPARADLTEVILVAMFTGMRLDEIASLKGAQIKEAEGVTYIQVDDAKTPAGIRQVPLHPRLGWLKDRAKAAKGGRIWPKFNPEGPGKKAGADAGREFSRFKQGRGFRNRQKAFHSFRKNVTRIMERAGVPENEWAQVFGHERGFTFGVYNPDGITLQRKADIIRLIDYSGLKLPKVA
jgi:integrase